MVFPAVYKAGLTKTNCLTQNLPYFREQNISPLNEESLKSLKGTTMAGTSIQTYLFFNGNCAEAVAHYCNILGGQVLHTSLYKDMPEGMVPPGFEDKVMHTTFQICGTTLMASDNCMGEDKYGGFSLSIAASSEEEAQHAFSVLAESGEIRMPLTKTFWSVCFGMLTDKYGIEWMVNVAA